MRLSLNNKFLIPTLGIILLGLGASTVISYRISKNEIEGIVKAQVAQITDSAQKHLSAWIQINNMEIARWSEQNYFRIAVKDTFMGKASRKAADEHLEQEKKRYLYYESLNVANEKGEIVSSSEGEKTENVYEQEFFQKALKGESAISDVFSSPLTQKPVFVISYPIKENERVAGVFFGIADMGYFSRKYIDSISDGQKVYAYMITRKGLLASHPDKSLIMKLNINDLDFGREIMSEDQTLIIYNFKEVKRLGAVRKNPDTGWRVGVSVKMSDIMASVLFLRKMNFSIAFILVILITSVIHFIVKSVVKPVNHVIAGLTESSERVASASEQVGYASQKLAQTSSEEAASFEEISASIEEISSSAKQNADDMVCANNLMKDTVEHIDHSANSFSELTVSMKEIEDAGRKTFKIIKTMEDIAFQTRLLSLNASIEAARAGKAGSGFTVVAEEFRNLSLRTAESLKDTSVLITDTIQKISNGTNIIENVKTSFSGAKESTAEVGKLLENIRTASDSQSERTEHISKAMTEIEHTVQTNATYSQETASVSEQMIAQAEQMKGFVSYLAGTIAGSPVQEKK